MNDETGSDHSRRTFLGLVNLLWFDDCSFRAPTAHSKVTEPFLSFVFSSLSNHWAIEPCAFEGLTVKGYHANPSSHDVRHSSKRKRDCGDAYSTNDNRQCRHAKKQIREQEIDLELHRQASISPSHYKIAKKRKQSQPGNQEKFGRRQRHRTKADKYTLKMESTRSSRDLKRYTPKQTKKRRRDLGKAWNHEFKAPNVEQERLTLRSHIRPGIFAKARASSPRRGLPDLTFPEMNSLCRRNADRSPHRRQRTRNHQEGKDSARGVSSYFAQPSAENPVSQESKKQDVCVKCHANNPKADPPVAREGGPQDDIACVDRGRGSGSLKNNPCDERILQKALVDTDRENNRRSIKHISKSHESVKCDSSKSGATTIYCSWSTTPTRSFAAINVSEERDGVKSQARDREDLRRHSEKAWTACIPQSSISQRSLERYTQSMLLMSRRDDRKHGADPNTMFKMYTLEELKQLGHPAQHRQPHEETCPSGEHPYQHKSLQHQVSHSVETAMAENHAYELAPAGHVDELPGSNCPVNLDQDERWCSTEQVGSSPDLLNISSCKDPGDVRHGTAVSHELGDREMGILNRDPFLHPKRPSGPSSPRARAEQVDLRTQLFRNSPYQRARPIFEAAGPVAEQNWSVSGRTSSRKHQLALDCTPRGPVGTYGPDAQNGTVGLKEMRATADAPSGVLRDEITISGLDPTALRECGNPIPNVNNFNKAAPDQRWIASNGDFRQATSNFCHSVDATCTPGEITALQQDLHESQARRSDLEDGLVVVQHWNWRPNVLY